MLLCCVNATAEVQRRAAPVVASGLDVIVKAETGSGKTLAYLAPALARLQYPPEVYPDDLKGPQVNAVCFFRRHDACLFEMKQIIQMRPDDCILKNYCLNTWFCL